MKFGFSYRYAGTSSSPYGLNLSFKVGDREENVRRNRAMFFDSLGIRAEHLAIPNQCHSATTLRIQAPGTFESCDAIVTDRNEVFLTITVADCVPIFVFDPVKKAVGAIHSGWRGTARGIVEGTIKKMESEFGSHTANLLAFVGPSARSCCYEVGYEVAREFEDSVVVKREGKTFLDLKEANVTQLVTSGIPKDNLEICPYCTICHPESFHSYRRDKERSGRMMGVIGLL
ncbi:MAG TPA: peptidoglycan editing factor PgeF [Bacteroidota bacterium]|nr:peptidoglycan editing factor PgeF [Bacteroidota bacterium]